MVLPLVHQRSDRPGAWVVVEVILEELAEILDPVMVAVQFGVDVIKPATDLPSHRRHWSRQRNQ